MKNIFPSIMTIIIASLIIAIVFVLLLIDFPDMISFWIFLGKVVGIWSVCYCLGYGGTWYVVTTMDKIKGRHKKRFLWYYNMGLLESAVLTEPKLAKKYWMPYG